MRIRVSVADKKGEQISQLKATIRQNKSALDHAKQSLKDGLHLVTIITVLVEEILQAFRLPQSQQQIQLQPLLRKLKVLLEGQYQPTNGSRRTPKTGTNIMGGPGGLRQGKTKLSQL